MFLKFCASKNVEKSIGVLFSVLWNIKHIHAPQISFYRNVIFFWTKDTRTLILGNIIQSKGICIITKLYSIETLQPIIEYVVIRTETWITFISGGVLLQQKCSAMALLFDWGLELFEQYLCVWLGGTLSIIFVLIGIKIGNQSSNLGWSYLCFTSY